MLQSQFIRFLLVGAANTVFGYIAFASLLFIGLYYPLALAGSTVLGIMFNFKTIGRYVFNNRNNSLIVRFVLAYGPIYAANVLALKLLAEYGLNHYLAQGVLVLPFAVASFYINRAFVFKNVPK